MEREDVYPVIDFYKQTQYLTKTTKSEAILTVKVRTVYIVSSAYAATNNT